MVEPCSSARTASIAFQAQDWNDDARNALDELLFTQFHPR